jgi:nucleotide-binding universal stress UspA family protein
VALQAKGFLMFKHILIPTDGSMLSEEAVTRGLEFAKSLDARVTGFFAIPEYPRAAYTDWESPDTMPEERYKLHWQDAAKHVLGRVRERASSFGVPCNTVYESDYEPYQGIIRTAEAHGCDLIFMASHGRHGLEALLLGSETQKVLTHTKIPVLVYRGILE